MDNNNNQEVEKSLKDDSVKFEVLRLDNDGNSSRQIEALTGISKSAILDFLSRKSYKEWWDDNGHKPIAAGNLDDHHKNIKKSSKKCFLITSAQNNTYVHNNMLKTLENIASRRNAQIIVGTFSYNKSGFQNLSKGDAKFFDPKIAPYIVDEPLQLAPDLIWCGELNILPTAVNPLSGFQNYTKMSSGIIPHAKLQMESIPTHKSRYPRMMYTTGAITQRNYIEKKAGQKASFHHIFGALIVEVDDDGVWFVRQLVADRKTGEIYDLDTLYKPDGSAEKVRVEAVNWGDLHSEKKDEEVYDISFGRRPDSIIDTLRPKYQFANDTIDFKSRNHHNIKDPYFRFAQYMKKEERVEENVADVCNTLLDMHRDFCQTIVVESNHDLAFRRWLATADYKDDPANAIYFLKNQLKMYEEISKGNEEFPIFEYAVRQIYPELDAKFLGTDESFVICADETGNGIECGQHGHLGANGSRGSINVYRKLGSRYNIGHSHSAGIKDGVYQAGVSGELDMGYNKGASSWSHSHIVTYPNGKRCILTIKNGRYRGKQ